MKTLITLILSPLLTTSLAFASDRDEKDDDDDAKADATKVAPDHIVDAKPLFDWSALGDNVPGGAGIGLGAEKRLSEKWYLTAEASAWTLDRSNDHVRRIQEDEDDDELIAKRRRAAALLVGGRYYGHPKRDTWYAG